MWLDMIHNARCRDLPAFQTELAQRRGLELMLAQPLPARGLIEAGPGNLGHDSFIL